MIRQKIAAAYIMASQVNVGYAADAVQYNSNEAYYLRAQEGGVFPGDLTVQGNLEVTGGQIALGAGAFITNDETPNVITSVSGINALTVTATEVAAAVPLSAPSISCAGTLGVSGAITGNATATFWDGGSGKVVLSGGGSGPTAFGTIQSFANDGTTVTALQMQPSGGAVNIPSISAASLGYAATPNVLIGSAGFTQYSMVICGTRFWWGTGSTGSGGSYTAIPLTGAGSVVPIMCQVTPLPNSVDDAYTWSAYCAVLSAGNATVNVINTVSGDGVLSAQFTYLVAAPGF